MERIHIGQGPDFCMMRGLTVINYRIKVTGIHNQIEFRPRVVADRSFAMILKKLKQNLPVSVKDLILVEMKLRNQNPKFSLKCQKHVSQFEVQFYLPEDLRIHQLDNIIKFFREDIKRPLQR